MMTTLSAMQLSRLKTRIIGALALLMLVGLTGCSSVRLAYGNASQLTWWWLDGYVDFSREQTPVAKRAIDRYFDWQRTTQLPELAPLLAQAQGVVQDPTTPAAVCRWQDQVREKLEPSLQRALAMAADLLPGLGEPQFRSIERKYTKNIEQMRKDYLQADPADRLEESYKRALERAENIYGRLGDAQKRVLREGVAASPFNPDLWLQERTRRQRDTLQTVRRLQAERADMDTRVAALRQLVVRIEKSPDPEYRAYQVKLNDYNCTLAAQLHNATTAAQRLKARDQLKGWEDDLKALVAGE